MINIKLPHVMCVLGSHDFIKWKTKGYKKANKYKTWEKCNYCGKTRKVKVK